MSNTNLQFSSTHTKLDWLFSHRAFLFLFFNNQIRSLKCSRESGVILNYILQNVLATYCANVPNNLWFSFQMQTSFYFRKVRTTTKEFKVSI